MKKQGVCWNRDSSASICQAPKYTRHNGNKDLVCASNGVTYASYNELACLRIYNHGECSLITSSNIIKNNFYLFSSVSVFFFPDIRILHDGPCKYKDIVYSSDVNQTCHLADNNAIIMPVCGSNNVTYPNPFVLKCAKHRGVVSRGMSAVREVAFIFIQNYLITEAYCHRLA
jgi:hypothetical protein